jgi:hypothetical protein
MAEKSYITIGADPELFIRDTGTGRFVSAHDVVPGSKHQPFPVQDGAIQVDGVAAEFNIEPASTVEEFLASIHSVVDSMSKYVLQKSTKYELVAEPTALFDKKYFRKLPHHAKELGCDPDYNAWDDGKPNESPATKEPFRTGGGHIHVGWTEGMTPDNIQHYFDCINMTKELDVALFVPSLLWDNDQRRRQLYGRMGSFRPKHYGVEYRPLSNAWMRNPEVAAWVFESARHTAELVLETNTRLTEDIDLLANISAGPDTLSKEALVLHSQTLEEYGYPSLPL